MRAFAEAWPDAEIVQQVAAQLPWAPPRTENRPEPTAPPASRETALAHIAKIMNTSTNAGDIAAQAMQAKGWQPHPA